MAWPGKVYAATAGLGVYYTESLGGPSDPQPVWAAVNGGLSSLVLRSFCLDLYASGGYQYCVDDANTVWRRTSGDWTAILDTATARALCGIAWGNCWHVACDPLSGRVAVNVAPKQALSWDQDMYVLLSDDHGESWTAHTTASTNYNYAPGNVTIHGDTIAACRLVDITASDMWHMYSGDGGLTWGTAVETGYNAGALGNYARAGEADDRYWWTRNYISTASGIRKIGRFDSLDGSFVSLGPIDDLAPDSPGGWWFDPADPAHIVVTNGERLLETLDGFATLVDEAPSAFDTGGYVAEIGRGCAYGQWLIGRSTFGAGCVRVTADGVTTADRSGTNNGTAPYTDAIPDVCGGIIGQGLWCVPESPGSWRVYSCRHEEVSA